jgi:hypothetical protein
MGTPVRSVRIGEQWEKARAVAAEDGMNMTELIEFLLSDFWLHRSMDRKRLDKYLQENARLLDEITSREQEIASLQGSLLSLIRAET